MKKYYAFIPIIGIILVFYYAAVKNELIIFPENPKQYYGSSFCQAISLLIIIIYILIL